jgi:putative ABC transport system permease protein
LESFWQDVRYGIRMLWKAPAFTVVAVLALALGIGANTAIFSVVNAVLIRPLPFPQSSRLLDIYHSYPKIGLMHASVSPLGLDFYLKNAKSFESMGGFTSYRAPANLTGSGEPQRLQSITVTGQFFHTLGISPMLGRAIGPADDQPGSNRVVVLGYALWKKQFAGDVSVVGKTITLDGANYTVIGVMPASFDYPSETDLWVPMAMTPEQWQEKSEFLTVVGRLKPGVSVEQARAEMAQLSAAVRRQYAKEFEGDTSGWHVDAQPLSESLRGDLRPALLVLLAAVGCVLLIACVNTANLLLARATSRQKEMATRVAIGATRRRIIRQLLTESTVLALAGGTAGLALGNAGVGLLMAMLPVDLPTYVKVTVDAKVTAFTFLLAIVTGLLFGIAPAWRISSPELLETLKEGRSSVGASHYRLRDFLVIGETALAVLLLVGAGLMIRSFVRFQSAQFGMDTHNVLTFAVSLPVQRYNDPARIRSFLQQANEKLQSLPGVEAAGMTTTPPLTGSGWTNSYTIEGKDIRPAPHSYFAVVSPGYFQALKIALVRGRFFSDSDGPDSPPTAVIDERAARMYFGDENPIGQHIVVTTPGNKQPSPREIVGVVGAVKHTEGVEEDTKGEVYLPYTQVTIPGTVFLVRTIGDPLAIGAAAREQIRDIDPEEPVFEMKTMDDIRSKAMAQPRFSTVLLGIFGGLALVLAAVGIYGVLSYTVTQRTHEIGLRMALGASQHSVLRMVLGRALKLAALGIGAGVVAALVGTRALSTLLYQVRQTDPLTYIAIAAVLAAVALLASYLPARRATRVDPMVALRNE